MSNLFSLFYALLKKLLTVTSPKHYQNHTPLTEDRRNRPITLKTHVTKEKAIASLNNVINEQVQSAQEKMTNAYNWGEVGYIEMNVITQIRNIIQNHDDIESPQEFVTACHTSFEDLVLQWQHNSHDSDGYGSATIRMIQRAFEQQ